jgi:DNA-binding response OmpR family regulator
MITQVLLIDDDPDEHEIFAHELKKYDSKITCVSLNDLESLSLINFLPDVVFLDMNMPKTECLNCLRIIKETLRFKDVPVYMYSTATYTHKQCEAFELGALKWITKPKTVTGYSQLFEELFPK